jgi:hypothetical protein
VDENGWLGGSKWIGYPTKSIIQSIYITAAEYIKVDEAEAGARPPEGSCAAR